MAKAESRCFPYYPPLPPWAIVSRSGIVGVSGTVQADGGACEPTSETRQVTHAYEAPSK